MRKITFENETNGLSLSFSTDTPMMFLESFDGCSCSTSDIVYKPFGYDGQYLVNSTLNPRTIPFTINFGGKSAGRYSRAIALRKWDEIQRVFAPGSAGVLTWTDGTNSRFIKARCTELSPPKQILPFLFSASISLVADKPLWLDTVENSVVFPHASGDFSITNECGIPVPVIIDVTTGANTMIISNFTVDKAIGFGQTVSGDFIIDCGECTVRDISGELCSHLIRADSEYWSLVPGVNNIAAVGDVRYARIRWRNAYAGVY